MATKPIDIKFPVLGIDESLSADNQVPLTTRDSVNVRTRDPISGRLRGAQRSGTEKFVTGRVYEAPSGGSSGEEPRVQDVAHVVYDSRRTLYAEHTPPSGGSWSGGSSGFVYHPTIEQETLAVWSASPPGDRPPQRVATDRYGNVYCVNLAGQVAKYNPDGELITSWTCPLDHQDQRVRSITVDEFGAVYLATYTGPRNNKGRVWRFIADEDSDEGEYRLNWTLEFLGYVRDLTVFRGRMYVIENVSDDASAAGFPRDTWGNAYVWSYDSLNAAQPRVLWGRAVPYPGSQLDVNEDGEVFVACLDNLNRGEVRGDMPTILIEWTPDWLTNYNSRVWCWLDAADITDKADGDEIDLWEDKSGNDRHLYKVTERHLDPDSHTPPTIRADGPAGQPMIYFNGSNGLVSQSSARAGEDRLALNKAIMPTADNQKWLLCMVIRPNIGAHQEQGLLHQPGDQNYEIRVNESDGLLPSGGSSGTEEDAGAYDHGAVRMRFRKSAGTDGVDAHATKSGRWYDEDEVVYNQDLSVLTFRMGGDDAVDESYFRVNGGTVDTFTLTRDKSSNQTQIGFWDEWYLLLNRQRPYIPDSQGGGIDSYSFYNDYLGSGGNELGPAGYQGCICEIICIRDTGVNPMTDAERDRIEGYLAWKWGCAHRLADGHPYPDSGGPPDFSSGPSSAPSSGPGGVAYENILNSKNGIVVKLGANKGDVIWAFAGSGVGQSIVVDDQGGVYNIGDRVQAPSGGASLASEHSEWAPDGWDVTVRKLNDDGATYSFGWSLTQDEYPQLSYDVKPVVDSERNLYLPHHTDREAGTNQGDRTIFKVDVDGVIEWVYNIDRVDGVPIDPKVSYNIALDPKAHDYNDDTIGEPMHVYVVVFDYGESDSLYKLELVSATPLGGSPRTHRYVAVAGGDVTVMGPVADSATTPTGGENALSADSDFIQHAVLYGEVFFVDGESIVIYQPRDDEVVEYTPTSAGELPARPKLVAAWRGALLFARFDGDAHNWFLTARGDPYNVDLAPPTPLATQAVIGNDSRTGVCPDIINTIVPYSDDLCFFGGDSSIHRLTGDPAAGGEFDLVSDQVGMAFGSPWAKDEEGTLYFWGSKGGVYAMAPGGVPMSISDGRISARLGSVDNAEFLVRMAWNWRDQGLDIFLVPRSTPTVIDHYFWERGSSGKPINAWQVTRFNSAAHQPTCVAVVDADDPDDRTTLIGCADGYVRKWSPEAVNDDGEPIWSRVVIGPYHIHEEARVRLTRCRVVMAADQDGAALQWAVSDSPEDLPEFPYATYPLSPGRNVANLSRICGHSLWARLTNGSVNERWAFESAAAFVAVAGRTR